MNIVIDVDDTLCEFTSDFLHFVQTKALQNPQFVRPEIMSATVNDFTSWDAWSKFLIGDETFNWLYYSFIGMGGFRACTPVPGMREVLKHPIFRDSNVFAVTARPAMTAQITFDWIHQNLVEVDAVIACTHPFQGMKLPVVVYGHGASKVSIGSLDMGSKEEVIKRLKPSILIDDNVDFVRAGIESGCEKIFLMAMPHNRNARQELKARGVIVVADGFDILENL